MKTQSFVITISTKNTSRSQVWDTESPMLLGQPFHWVLEKTALGVRLREMPSAANKVVKTKCVDISAAQMKSGIALGHKGSVKLQLKPVVEMKAPTKPAQLTEAMMFHDKAVRRPDPELRIFHRALQGTGLSFALFMLVAHLIPAPEKKEEEVIPPQFAKIVMQQAPKPKGTTESVQAKAAPTTKSAKATASVKNSVVQAFRSNALQSAASSLLKGGMSKLLQQSDFVMGNASTEKARRAIASSSDALRTTAPKTGMMEGKTMKVAAIGGASEAAGGVGYATGEKAAVQGQGNAFVKIDVSNSLVDEGLTRDEVGEVIHRHLAEIRYCYESSMSRQPDIAGKLIVGFVIGGPGNVKSVEVKTSTLSDPKLDDCILRRLSSWQFPKPRGGSDVAVTYPFIFKSLGG